MSEEGVTFGAIALATGQFIMIGLGSTAIGIFLGMLNALILRRTLIKKQPPMEILMILGFAYVSYVLCDGIGLSGTVIYSNKNVSIDLFIYTTNVHRNCCYLLLWCDD